MHNLIQRHRLARLPRVRERRRAEMSLQLRDRTAVHGPMSELQWDEALASPQTGHELIQSEW